ncbi:MAG: DUF2905 domain-containing protein [Gammaproteobacteria bacterium]|nr:DUF2905 domain-containing protein [Gammaproteobacteria bacterium]
MSRALIIIGLVFLVAGAVARLGPRGVFGHLPGDFAWRIGHVRIFVPLGSSLLVSLIFTLVLWLLRR